MRTAGISPLAVKLQRVRSDMASNFAAWSGFKSGSVIWLGFGRVAAWGFVSYVAMIRRLAAPYHLLEQRKTPGGSLADAELRNGHDCSWPLATRPHSLELEWRGTRLMKSTMSPGCRLQTYPLHDAGRSTVPE